jgi:hypothetical protein
MCAEPGFFTSQSREFNAFAGFFGQRMHSSDGGIKPFFHTSLNSVPKFHVSLLSVVTIPTLKTDFGKTHLSATINGSRPKQLILHVREYRFDAITFLYSYLFNIVFSCVKGRKIELGWTGLMLEGWWFHQDETTGL